MMADMPTVLLAILAKQKEAVLPFYLECIEALDYPKKNIHLYVRTNNNTDATASLLLAWLGRVGAQYASVELDTSAVPEPVERYGIHEWNAERFKVLGKIRQTSLLRALERQCAFYFTADVDNFLRPETLKNLVDAGTGLGGVVAPLLRHDDATQLYSNYHHKVDEAGYFQDSEPYKWILQQTVRGLLEVPVVHCTYLIRADAIPRLVYDDGSGRYEYVVFSESARRAGIPQHLDNRLLYGYLTLTEDSAQCRKLLQALIPRE